jgi:hypothetical protein
MDGASISSSEPPVPVAGASELDEKVLPPDLPAVERSQRLNRVQQARATERAVRTRTRRLALGASCAVGALAIGGLWLAASRDRGTGNAGAAIYASFWFLWLVGAGIAAIGARSLVFAAAARSLTRARRDCAVAAASLYALDSAAHYRPSSRSADQTQSRGGRPGLSDPSGPPGLEPG